VTTWSPGDRSPYSRARELPGRLLDQVRDTVDAALDRVFDEPFDIRSAADYERVLLDPAVTSRGGTTAGVAGALAAFVTLAAPFADRGLKILRSSGRIPVPAAKAAKYAAVAVPVGIRLTSSSRRGVRELQVLASYIVHRMRAAGVQPDRGLVRAATVSIYLDPERRPVVGLSPRRAAAAIARIWIFRAFGTDSDAAVITRAHAQMAAVDRLDPGDLVGRPALPA
jgi:hypothetical protein